MLNVLVIGSGQRVRRAALPALLARDATFRIAGIYSRKSKQISAEDKAGEHASNPMEVRSLSELDAKALAASDLVYLCVSKGAVPQVLKKLAGLTRTAPQNAPALLIDTPVLYFKHMGAARHFAAFNNVWVAEDMSSLPWLDALNATALGRPRHLTLDRSAFAYHGVALAKTLLEDMSLRRARRIHTGTVTQSGEPCHERHFTFTGGARCLVLEPRNYSVGSFRLKCELGVLCDPGSGKLEAGDHQIACHFDGGRCVGFQAIRDGEVVVTTELASHEIHLLGEFDNAAPPGPIAHMDAMKRVGFARLLDRIANDETIWSLHDGLDDMWIDYLTEKIGHWRRTPFTSAHAGFARRFVSTSMSIASRIKG